MVQSPCRLAGLVFVDKLRPGGDPGNGQELSRRGKNGSMSGENAPDRHASTAARSRRLDSWKEIADYLRVAERTAVRWEKERGLPVYRLPGGKRGAVYSESGEIDAWLRKGAGPRPASDTPSDTHGLTPTGPSSGESQTDDSSLAGEPPSPGPVLVPDPEARADPRWRSRGEHAGWAGVVLIALGVAWAWFATPAGGSGSTSSSRLESAIEMPTRARILPLERAVVAESDGGRILWRHEVPETIAQLQGLFYRLEQATHVVDLDGDGEVEVLASVPVHVSPGSGNTEIAESRLRCFSSQGQLLWEKVFREELAFQRDRFHGPWSHGIVRSVKVGSIRRVLWAVHHWNWWPSVLFSLDHHGREMSRFVHAGHIATMTPSEHGSRPHVLVGGVSNAYQAGFLAVLDAERLSGAGLTEPGSPYECLACPPGRPDRYLLFEPSEVTRAAGIPYNGVHEILALSNGYSVATADWDIEPQVVSYFDLDLSFRLRHSGSTAKLGIAHRRLEREGKIDHSWETCREREQPPRVRLWEADKGWADLTPLR